ncbi:VOC family protein [Kibdelosporangium phytohabitans]|uniref:Glyoxalase n=1 Tax=Kibdelosporangium phytohabitans TaxID=860235 RepID=A0A0N9HYM9_9PSEU|nr:VOC family protein [Kibdelosporangium phytohabitans]ALG07250.1 glyoxalase [Kibdelosporangium phytohabitans]MBE1471891.1 catechol 2,3-dioxygenase-like lactoylglutathione lyase family enzyme [Kibdelosporangium phytohabitans]
MTTLKAGTIMLGVRDVDRAKKFYAEGMGAEIEQDYPGFVTCKLGAGSNLALYAWDAAAQDAGVSPDGSGFRGVSFHHLTDSRDEVDEVMRAAVAAGGTVVKEAEAAQWGGYFGFFSDLDGYLWKVASAT